MCVWKCLSRGLRPQSPWGQGEYLLISPLLSLKMVIFAFFMVDRKLLWLLSPFKNYLQWLSDDICRNPQGCIFSNPVDSFMSRWLKRSLTLVTLWLILCSHRQMQCYCISLFPVMSQTSDSAWTLNSSYLFFMCMYLGTNTWDRL